MPDALLSGSPPPAPTVAPSLPPLPALFTAPPAAFVTVVLAALLFVNAAKLFCICASGTLKKFAASAVLNLPSCNNLVT